MSSDFLLFFSILIPLVSSLFLVLTDKYPDVRETITISSSILLFGVVYLIAEDFLSEEYQNFILIEILPNISLSLKVEPLGLIFALIASTLWIINSIYSIGYMRGNKEKNQTRFYVCFAISISSVMGISFSENLLTLFVFYEILTFSTFPLVTHHGNQNSLKGGITYLSILAGTSIAFFLLAIVITWSITGTIDFKPGGIIHDTNISSSFVSILLALFVFGVGKAAIMPFHRWLPAAMVAPTPVSALLHAVAVVKAGVFCITKIIIYIFGFEFLYYLENTNWLVFLACFTIISASIVALKSDNLKRRLAYSTISQLSYVILSASLLTPISVIGATMHIIAHAFSKIVLFFAAGSIYTVTKKNNISELSGIGKQMPITMTAFTVGAISLIGIPPAVGFVSKWFIISGAFLNDSYLVVAVLILSTLLNAAYFLPITYRAFFMGSFNDNNGTKIKEAPVPILVSLLLSSFFIIILFFFSENILNLAEQIVY